MTERTLTEKTLDERVAEALGWRLHESMGFYIDIKTQECAMKVAGHKSPFFTGSISNCEKYIEPVLSSVDRLCSLTCEKIKLGSGDWIYYVIGRASSTELFSGRGDTKGIAYCHALFDLRKEEEKRRAR